MGISAVEVYPAATLRAHSINAKGYKRRSNLADALDAVVCLAAGADFLRGLAMPPADLSLAKQEGWIWVCSMRG